MGHQTCSGLRAGIRETESAEAQESGRGRATFEARARTEHSPARLVAAAPRKSVGIQPEKRVHGHEECEREIRAKRQGERALKRLAALSNAASATVAMAATTVAAVARQATVEATARQATAAVAAVAAMGGGNRRRRRRRRRGIRQRRWRWQRLR